MAYFSDRPQFTTYPEPADATEPQKPVVFKCRARGSPAPTINWFKDGLLILGTPEESRFHITMEGSLVFMGKRYHITREGSLIIFDPRVEDEGTYKCQAENAMGKISYEVSLYVEMSKFFCRTKYKIDMWSASSSIIHCGLSRLNKVWLAVSTSLEPSARSKCRTENPGQGGQNTPYIPNILSR